MISRLVASAALTAVALMLGTASASSQQYIQLPLGTWCNDITPDGAVVVGSGNGGAYYWRWRDEPAPTFIGGHGATGVSDDGLVITGNMDDPTTGNQVAGRWTQATGWVALGGPSTCGSISSAYDISGDGTQIVGLAWLPVCDAVGFRWTEGVGMEFLESMANGTNRCSAISGDGSVMGGFAQGSFNRTPAIWFPDLSGHVFDEDDVGEIYGFNEDGTILLGAANGDAYFQTDGGGVVSIGKLHASIAWTGIPEDVTQDGSTIVGFDVSGLSRQAWMWTAKDGMISMNNRLNAAGLGAGVAPVLVCRAVSEDGNVVVGGVTDGGGPFGFAGYIVEWESDLTWQDLGGGLAGAGGEPILAGSGTLLTHSLLTIDVSNAPTNAPMLAWVSISSVPFPYFSGTIHAVPHVTEIFLAANGAGAFSGSATWPPGVPSGSEFWFQFLVGDGTAPAGIALTNALKATTP